MALLDTPNFDVKGIQEKGKIKDTALGMHKQKLTNMQISNA